MESRTKFAGHALHPILIVFPLGLLVTAVAFDLVYLVTDRESFAPAAAFTIAAGLIGGALAGLVGLVDWLALPGGTRAKRVGLLHGAVNLAVLALFAASWLLRLGEDAWGADGAGVRPRGRRRRARGLRRLVGRRAGRAPGRGRRRRRQPERAQLAGGEVAAPGRPPALAVVDRPALSAAGGRRAQDRGTRAGERPTTLRVSIGA